MPNLKPPPLRYCQKQKPIVPPIKERIPEFLVAFGTISQVRSCKGARAPDAKGKGVHSYDGDSCHGDDHGNDCCHNVAGTGVGDNLLILKLFAAIFLDTGHSSAWWTYITD